MLVSLTVGKVDAGVAVLLTQDKRLIEFPSILLPPNISSGSIVDITVARNFKSEAATQNSFLALQEQIYNSFGRDAPQAPVLRCRNATQTSVVLEWDAIEHATADILSLSLYRNGSKAGVIPKPGELTSTKISGLAVDTEYTFHLVLRTTAGTFSSEKVVVKTHKMTDLSGITITPGYLPAQLRDSLAKAVERIGAKIVDQVRLDTTHFVTTEGRGDAWEKAVEMNVPVVRPEWVEGCERGGRIVGVRQYYLDADPRQRQVPATEIQTAPVVAPTEQRRETPPASTSPPERPSNNSSVRPPTPPASTSPPERPSNNSSVRPPTPPAKDEVKKEESSDEEDDEEDREENKSAVQDEQKVRVEDREKEGLPVRPAAVESEEESEADEKDDKDEKAGKEDEPKKKLDVADEGGSGSRTPGSASFQDVAL